MRLLNTKSLELETFYGDTAPPYAILSHTWAKPEDEVSFQELSDPAAWTRSGYQKIRDCCNMALTYGFHYSWIDTCCIDKSSTTELSEAINSMYRWYQKAEICLVYLVDIKKSPSEYPSEADSVLSPIASSRWFTRGWTLQELLAPRQLVFYDCDWQFLGTKAAYRDHMLEATGIQPRHVEDPTSACIAVKMSWLSRRTTTRKEDMAYCVLGIFEVNMALIYGEEENAFARLQREIFQHTPDGSLFAWSKPDLEYGGLLAPSPSTFAQSGDISLLEDDDAPLSFLITNRGMQIRVKEHDSSTFLPDKPCVIHIDLRCFRQNGQNVQIELVRVTTDVWVRKGQLSQRPRLQFPNDEAHLICVPLATRQIPRLEAFKWHHVDHDCQNFIIHLAYLENTVKSNTKLWSRSRDIKDSKVERIKIHDAIVPGGEHLTSEYEVQHRIKVRAEIYMFALMIEVCGAKYILIVTRGTGIKPYMRVESLESIGKMMGDWREYVAGWNEVACCSVQSRYPDIKPYEIFTLCSGWTVRLYSVSKDHFRIEFTKDFTGIKYSKYTEPWNEIALGSSIQWRDWSSPETR